MQNDIDKDDLIFEIKKDKTAASKKYTQNKKWFFLYYAS